MEPQSAAVPQHAARPSLLSSGALSVATSAAPLLVALLALPVLTRYLGTERLGLLALAWAWLGYAALLDFGLGRALTRMVAASGPHDPVPIAAYVATAHVTLTVVGAIVGVLGAVLAPWYIGAVLHVSPALRSDAIISAVLFALTVPAVTGASVPRAVLEARHEFRAVNFIRLPVSVGTFAVPVLLLPVTASLSVIAGTLAAVRLWAWWRYATLARRLSPVHAADTVAHRHHLPALFRAGAWTTVSNVLSPLMNVADRFLIGALVSVQAVAIYAVPWEAITKLWIVPGALTMVLFPTLARAAASDPAQLVALHNAAVRLLVVGIAPVCAAACLLAPWLLALAGGQMYRSASADVLRVLAVGVCANAIAMIPFTLLQAAGRARTTALLHLIEIVPFLLGLWAGVHWYGVVGAAAVWSVRAVLDALLMLAQAQRVAALPASTIAAFVASLVLVMLAAALSAWVTLTLPAALALTGACAAAALGTIWLRRAGPEWRVLHHAGTAA
jgi:O-antigen/teichoic acid export membrane protein